MLWGSQIRSSLRSLAASWDLARLTRTTASVWGLPRTGQPTEKRRSASCERHQPMKGTNLLTRPSQSDELSLSL
jgi:hypothetical protein